jgi:hypothetical protein
MGDKGKLRELLEQLKDNLARNAHVEDQGPGDLLLQEIRDALEALPACLLNAKDGEPLFVLRGQDLTAPFTVELWCYLQLAVRNLIRTGETEDQALALVTQHFKESMTSQGIPAEEVPFVKIGGAYEICERMKEWQPKKLAD